MTAFDIDAVIRSLTGGTGVDDFNEHVRERRAAHFAAALAPHALAELYGLSRLEALVRHEAVSTPYVDIFDEQHLRRLADVQRKSGKSSLEVLADNFRAGATVRIRDADRFDARLSAVAAAVQQRFAAQCQINVYLTPPAKVGFPPHFDITDVFIVQCLGTKEWRIFHDYTNAAPLPLPHTNWDPERFAPAAQPQALTLAPGDVLYLPRGVMHSAFCADRESLHLTISLAPLTFADVLAKALRLAADGDAALRRRVPWSNDEPDGGARRLAAAAREQLRQAVERVDLEALLRAEHGALRAPEPAAAPGQLDAAIASLLESAAAAGNNGGDARRSE